METYTPIVLGAHDDPTKKYATQTVSKLVYDTNSKKRLSEIILDGTMIASHYLNGNVNEIMCPSNVGRFKATTNSASTNTWKVNGKIFTCKNGSARSMV